MKHLVVGVALLLVGGCDKSKVVDPPSVTPASQFVEDSWVPVTVTSDNHNILVNKSSIFPHGDMTMAEVAYQTDKKYMAKTVAFDCPKRMMKYLRFNGEVTPERPVLSFEIYASIFNYVCFRIRSPDAAIAAAITRIDIAGETPE
jgi:hypothetical protein